MAKNSVKARIRDVLTGEEFDTFGLSENVNPTLGYVLIDASLRPEVYIRVPVVGMEDQEPPLTLAARFVDPPASIEVGVATAFVPELFTEQGTAESYAGNESRWTFETSSGSFVGNMLTVTVEGPVTITARHTGGQEAIHQLTAFVDQEVPPETTVFDVDFSGEVDGTTPDEITAASGHTFVDSTSAPDGMQVSNGRLYRAGGTSHARTRAVGGEPPAEFDLLWTFTILTGGESPGPYVGVAARVSDDFSQYYDFLYQKGAAVQRFSIHSSGLPSPIFGDRDLAPGTYDCRVRVRNAYKAIDIMVGANWEEVVRVNDNSVVGGAIGIVSGGTNSATEGIHLDSVQAAAPSADPEVDTEVNVGGVPAEAVENTDYQIHSQLRQLDGTVVSDSLDSPEDWTHVVEAGGSQASIGGPNDDVLEVGALV